jgi:transcriptional regulator with XRE-family HTH domain
MATKDRPADRGRRDAANHIRAIASELREARLAAGLSQSHVGRALGISHAGVSRIERGLAPNIPLRTLETMAAVLGLRMSVRLYPAGLPLRDDGQLALLERLRAKTSERLTWTTERPIPIAGDLRAWDASIDGPGWTVYVDAETRIRDVQAWNGEPRSNAGTPGPTESSFSLLILDRIERSSPRCAARSSERRCPVPRSSQLSNRAVILAAAESSCFSGTAVTPMFPS